ncbi:SDR family oxidoreductase [Brucepastera parasyntrophica]|uniref:SDR family oxidoreductase n=1 Tax=Brucepastera parasyntrophica TaxID=2880008 RepID=UPI00210ACD73|nr:SDR family oxidoreductase [Brucepastera parasyntrophica]ULQ58936.1 SDR family oxidoreductase [Brucepastera parasyntrophica]
MKALFIGGTGTISSSITKLASESGWELYLLNRGTSSREVPAGVNILQADINGDESVIAELVKDLYFDAVADFIAFVPEQIERDIRLFSGKTRQFIFISSASAYQKPLNYYRITESTPLSNPLWEYSRNKIACEERLMAEYRKTGFPCTIIRPSHTYNDRHLPLAVHGKKGPWQVVARMLEGKPVIVHGDGSSLWTLTHSEDFAKAFYGIMGNPAAIGEVFHITSDEALTWDAIYRRIAEALNITAEMYHVTTDFLSACDPDFTGTLAGDKSNTVVFDNTKIKRLVPGFNASIRFDEGARRCVRYLLNEPAAQIPDPEFDTFCDTVIALQETAKRSFRP